MPTKSWKQELSELLANNGELGLKQTPSGVVFHVLAESTREEIQVFILELREVNRRTVETN